jgi:hypothetical protein
MRKLPEILVLQSPVEREDIRAVVFNHEDLGGQIN